MVLDNGERDVAVRFCADRKEAHQRAVAQQCQADQLGTTIAGAEVDQLRPLIPRHPIDEITIEQNRLVQAGTLEGVYSL